MKYEPHRQMAKLAQGLVLNEGVLPVSDHAMVLTGVLSWPYDPSMLCQDGPNTGQSELHAGKVDCHVLILRELGRLSSKMPSTGIEPVTN